jgi:uncharacterized membrane protein YkvA (DUF1232 family)
MLVRVNVAPQVAQVQVAVAFAMMIYLLSCADLVPNVYPHKITRRPSPRGQTMW